MKNIISGHEIEIQDTGAPRGEPNYWRVNLNGVCLYFEKNGAKADRLYAALCEAIKQGGQDE